MNTQLLLVLLTCILLISGCNKSVSYQKTESATDVYTHQTQSDAQISGDDSSDIQTGIPDTNQESAENQSTCLKYSGPFCEVFVADSDCDPKLIENHYKPGDRLYWVNYTQYDTIDCYYTELEYKENHNHADCAELQDNGRGCIIDNAPACNLWLDEEDCTVVYSRSACDEKLIDLNKNVGDLLPGIWFVDRKTMKCFYSYDERKEYLKKSHLKCENDNDLISHICEVNPK